MGASENGTVRPGGTLRPSRTAAGVESDGDAGWRRRGSAAQARGDGLGGRSGVNVPARRSPKAHDLLAAAAS
jgi:hypothetical protein